MIPLILAALGGAIICNALSSDVEKLKDGGKVPLLAPNGKPSNLTKKQWNLVRTPEFKAWFGDWEKDHKNASKVVDENGEPLPCFHGTEKKINKFNRKYSAQGIFWFTSDKDKIIRGESGALSVKVLIEVFINAKNIAGWNEYKKLGIGEIKGRKFDCIKLDENYIVFEPTQIKLADGSNTKFDSSNPDIRYAKGGLIAPNGKASNLTEEQYKLVRTPEFKAWFGDWEKDPKNSSKVVDNNGEPLICFHGTDSEFNVFDLEKQNSGWLSRGFYFTENESEAQDYGKKVISVFLSIKKPFIIKPDIINEDFTVSWSKNTKEQIIESYSDSENIDWKDVSRYLKTKGHDGIINSNNLIVAYTPNQIKLADGTNTTFDSSNPDIRFGNGGGIENENRQDYLKWKRKNVTLRGIGGELGEENKGMANYGSGLYTAFLGNKEMAREYGKVYFVLNAIPKNPKIVYSVNGAEMFIQDTINNWCKKRGMSYNSNKFYDETNIKDEMLSLGYDGLVIKGREMVNYTPPENVMYFENEEQLEMYYYNKY